MIRKFRGEVFDEDWFASLSPHYKALWFYLWHRCTDEGLWNVNLSIAWAIVGEKGEVGIENIIKRFNVGKVRMVVYGGGLRLLNLEFLSVHHGLVMNLNCSNAARRLYIALSAHGVENKIPGLSFKGDPVKTFSKNEMKRVRRSNFDKIALEVAVEPVTFDPHMEGVEGIERIEYNPTKDKLKSGEVPVSESTLRELREQIIQDVEKKKNQKRAKAIRYQKVVSVNKIHKRTLIKIVTQDKDRPTDYLQFDQADVVAFASFETWVNNNGYYFGRVKQPLSISEFLELRESYGADAMQSIITKLGARRITKHKSAYLCFIAEASIQKLVPKNKEVKK